MRGTYVRACNECVDEMVGSGQDGLLLHEAGRTRWMGVVDQMTYVGPKDNWAGASTWKGCIACRCTDCRNNSDNGKGLLWIRTLDEPFTGWSWHIESMKGLA